MNIYDRIRELRIERGMTQDDLAKAMGYKDRSMITKIEGGKVDISQKKILHFAKVLGTTEQHLMGWDLDLRMFDAESDQTNHKEDPSITAVSTAMYELPEAQREQLAAMVLAVATQMKNQIKEG